MTHNDTPLLRTPPVERRLRRRSAIVGFPLIVAACLFFGPAAGFLLGDRAEPIDNRPLAEFPTLNDGWDFFPKFQAWANDHLPLRSQAIAAGTRISEGLFQEPPRFSSDSVGVAGAGSGAAPAGTAEGERGVDYPSVISGKDGWLFFGSDVESACEPEESVDTIIEGFQTLSDAAADSGREFVIAIAPDKSSAHPELLPDVFAGRDCMEERRDEFWTAVRQLEGVTVIDPTDALSRFEDETGRPVWRKYDTHWNQEGATVFSQSIVSQLDPSLLESTAVRQGPSVDADGDLSGLIGDPQAEALTSTIIERPGVNVYLDGKRIDVDDTPSLPYSPVTTTAKTTDAPLYAPKTFLLGDSFFEASRTKFPQFFQSLTYVHNMTGQIPGANEVLTGSIADSETVIYELVERAAVAGAVSYQKPENYEALADAMLSNPVE